MSSDVAKPCWDYSMPLQLWAICFLPVIAAVWAWVMVYKNRHGNSRKFASSVALTLLTASAMVSAVGTVYLTYFACVPKSTVWTALPEYTLDSYVMLLAFSSLVAGFVALKRGHSRKLCGIVLLMSGWQLFFSLMHAATL